MEGTIAVKKALSRFPMYRSKTPIRVRSPKSLMSSE